MGVYPQPLHLDRQPSGALIDQPVVPTQPALREAVMVPLGASGSWSWHGYRDSYLDVADRRVPVVSGGAHWGGGLFMSAADLARIGQLYLTGG